MTPIFPSFFARSKSAASCTLKNASGCFSINRSAFAIADMASSKFPSGPPSVDFTTFTPESTIRLVRPARSSFEAGIPISPNTFPSSTNALRYNSAATGDTDSDEAVADGSPDHRASGLIAVRVTAPPSTFVNRRRLIMSEGLPKTAWQFCQNRSAITAHFLIRVDGVRLQRMRSNGQAFKPGIHESTEFQATKTGIRASIRKIGIEERDFRDRR